MRRGVPSAQRRPWPASAARGRPAPRPDGSPRATCSCLPSCRRAPGRQGQPPSPDWFAVSPAPSAGRLQARAGHLCAHLYRGFDLSTLPLRPRRLTTPCPCRPPVRAPVPRLRLVDPAAAASPSLLLLLLFLQPAAAAAVRPHAPPPPPPSPPRAPPPAGARAPPSCLPQRARPPPCRRALRRERERERASEHASIAV